MYGTAAIYAYEYCTMYAVRIPFGAIVVLLHGRFICPCLHVGRYICSSRERENNGLLPKLSVATLPSASVQKPPGFNIAETASI